MSRTSDEKYIRYVDSDSEELYDLQNDPREQDNVVEDGELDEHTSAIDAFVDEIRRTSSHSESVEIGEELEEQLENLGYK